jgi:hypothetical protein
LGINKMKQLLRRLFGRGTDFTQLEGALLKEMVAALPDTLRIPVQAQIDACNLIQREIDGRALNFYRTVRGKPNREGLPVLPIKPGEVVLLKAAFRVPGHDTLFHATLNAVNGQFFCLSLSHDLALYGKETAIVVQNTTPSWRSNLVDAQLGVPADGPASRARG